MTQPPSLLSARAATQARVRRQQYCLSWRGSGESEIVGITTLPARLKLSLQSVRVYLSKGKGSFTLTRANPLTGEDDLLTVTHIPEAPPIAKRRGRPPKQVDWERLGSEAPNRPTGTHLAESAKAMPKTRNRRTDETGA